MGEVHQALIPQGCLVSPVAAAHCGQEGDAGVNQVLGSDQLVDDAVEVLGGLVQIPVPVAPQPAAQRRLVGTEDVMEMRRKQVQPLPFIQQCGGRIQDPATDAVDRCNAHPVQLAVITGGPGGAAETLAQCGGGGPAEGAQHQLLRLDFAQQQQVQAPHAHHHRLAGAGTGDDTQGTIPVADNLQLPEVELRVKLFDHGVDHC